MATSNPSFIIKRYDSFGGKFIDSQYLGASYETGKPHQFMNTLTKIFSAKSRFIGTKPLLSMTGGRPGGVKEIDTEVYRWKLQGAEYKCARVIENLEAANTAPGLNGANFSVKLDLDFFSYPEVMLPEDPDFPVAVVEGPVDDGTGYIYTFRLEGDNPTAFLPTDLLREGAEFSKSWTSVQSERNQYFGGQQYATSFMLEGQVSAFAQEVVVTDKAWRDQGKLAVEFFYTDYRTGKRQKVTKFLPYAEAMMHEELMMSIEAQSWYGKKQTKQGPDGYWVKTGAGVREQMRDGHTEFYNGPLTTTRIKDYLLDIFFAREDEQNRSITALTGTLGSVMFHDMLATEAASFLQVDTHFTTKIKDKPRHLSFGAQYKHYQGPEGIEMDLMLNPLYDSRRYCKRKHPTFTNFPIDSTRFTFMDFGSTQGEDNITQLRVKDTTRWGWVAGTHTPTGPVQGGQAGGKIAGYDMFTETTSGTWIKDVTKTGELIFDDEA